MASKITRIVLDAQVHCHLKAYFRLCGEEGIKSDFETLLLDALQEARAKAIGKILGHYADGEVEMDIPLSRTALESDSNRLCNARALISLRKRARTSIMGCRPARHHFDDGNAEPSDNALYCRFEFPGQVPVGRRRRLGGPDIDYRIEMTR